MRLKSLCAALAVAGLAAACGGDGGGDTAAPAPTTSTVTLQGVAAKGVLGKAVVSVHPVKTDGSVDIATVLATATTADNGTYTLPSFTATPGAAYVVRVTAVAGQTFTVDEITQAQVPLPADFVMRGLLVAPSTATAPIVANVTPFSEMAVAAAAGATGGVSAANATQALANVRVLLGFDPATTTPTTLQGATTPEQQTLAVMLTAVSKLANDGELGCASTDLGARTQCVVAALSSSASLTSTKPGTVGGVDVAAELAQSAAAVVADPVLTAGTTVSAGTIGAVTGNLAGPGTVVKPGTADAIVAANALFDGLRSDVTELFSRGGVSSLATGAVNQEAYKFQEAMEGVQAPVEMLIKDVGAVTLGVDLYLDYIRSNGTTSPNRTRGSADDVANASTWVYPNLAAVSCGLYADEANTQLATSVASAKFVGCQSIYYMDRVITGATTATVTRWRHGFSIAPQPNGTFTYQSRARKTTQNCTGSTCTQTLNQALQETVSVGTVTPTVTDGRITAYAIQGDLPGMFDDGGNTLVNAKTTVSLSGTRVIGADNMSTSTLQGSAVAYDAAGAKLSTLTITSGSLSEVAVSWDANDNLVARNSPAAVAPAGGDVATASLAVVWATPSAEFEGAIALTDSVWDKSLTTHVPTKGSLTGALRNIASDGTKTEFFTGSINATVSNFAQYTANLDADDSAANHFGVSLAVAGTVTAPSRPKLELTGNTSMLSHEDGPDAATLTYKSIVGGTPKRQVSLTATRGTDGKYTVKLSEAASNLSMTYVEGAASADILSGTEVIGTFTDRDKLVTFVNKQQVSLDFGL